MEPTETQPPAGASLDPLVKLTHVIYGLYAASLFIGLTGIVAIIMAYVKRDEARGTRLESHFTWLIRTFWIGLIGAAIGGVTLWIFGLGTIVWGIVGVWFIYRIVKGWLALNDGRPIAEPEAIV